MLRHDAGFRDEPAVGADDCAQRYGLVVAQYFDGAGLYMTGDRLNLVLHGLQLLRLACQLKRRVQDIPLRAEQLDPLVTIRVPTPWQEYGHQTAIGIKNTATAVSTNHLIGLGRQLVRPAAVRPLADCELPHHRLAGLRTYGTIAHRDTRITT